MTTKRNTEVKNEKLYNSCFSKKVDHLYLVKKELPANILQVAVENLDNSTMEYQAEVLKYNRETEENSGIARGLLSLVTDNKTMTEEERKERLSYIHFLKMKRDQENYYLKLIIGMINSSDIVEQYNSIKKSGVDSKNSFENSFVRKYHDHFTFKRKEIESIIQLAQKAEAKTREEYLTKINKAS